jgi:hypothetical protein
VGAEPLAFSGRAANGLELSFRCRSKFPSEDCLVAFFTEPVAYVSSYLVIVSAVATGEHDHSSIFHEGVSFARFSFSVRAAILESLKTSPSLSKTSAHSRPKLRWRISISARSTAALKVAWLCSNSVNRFSGGGWENSQMGESRNERGAGRYHQRLRHLKARGE